MALAPKLNLLANGLEPMLVGLPMLPSPSSIALSSTADETEETDEIDPRRMDMLVWNPGGEVPVAFDMLIRRLLACAAAAVEIGPG